MTRSTVRRRTSGTNHTLGIRFGGRLATLCSRWAEEGNEVPASPVRLLCNMLHVPNLRDDQFAATRRAIRMTQPDTGCRNFRGCRISESAEGNTHTRALTRTSSGGVMRCNLKTSFSRAGRIWPSIYVVTLLIAFCASRLVYASCGVEFRIKPLLNFLMQVLDVRQLRDNLREAIWYLHAQPPLFNALIGVVLRAPENAQQTIFTVLYSAVAFTGI